MHVLAASIIGSFLFPPAPRKSRGKSSVIQREFNEVRRIFEIVCGRQEFTVNVSTISCDPSEMGNRQFLQNKWMRSIARKRSVPFVLNHLS
jgi:hypothetical protein